MFVANLIEILNQYDPKAKVEFAVVKNEHEDDGSDVYVECVGVVLSEQGDENKDIVLGFREGGKVNV